MNVSPTMRCPSCKATLDQDVGDVVLVPVTALVSANLEIDKGGDVTITMVEAPSGDDCQIGDKITCVGCGDSTDPRDWVTS